MELLSGIVEFICAYIEFILSLWLLGMFLSYLKRADEKEADDMYKCELYNDQYLGLRYEVKVWKNDYPNLFSSVPKEHNQAGYVYIPKRILEDPTILAEVEVGEDGYTSYYANDILCGMPVHGGITYHNNMPEYYKVGWDYQHLDDGEYSIEYVEAECKRCIDYFRNHPDIKWKE